MCIYKHFVNEELSNHQGIRLRGALLYNSLHNENIEAVYSLQNGLLHEHFPRDRELVKSSYLMPIWGNS